MSSARFRTVVATATLVALAGLGTGGVALAQQEPPPVASIPNLTGQSTSVKLDSGFTDALTSLEVKPGVLGKATLADGSVKFPITGGNVTVYPPGSTDPFVRGSIQHEGSGLSLSKGETKVDLEDFVVDPGKPAVLTGKVSAGGKTVADSVKLFDLDGSTLKPIQTDAGAGTATLTGTTVRLSEEAAQALNKAFSTDAIKGGTTVGIATIVVDLPGKGKGGDTSGMPKGGVETGGGSTAGSDSLDLVGPGVALLAVAGGLVLIVVRRRAAAGRN